MSAETRHGGGTKAGPLDQGAAQAQTGFDGEPIAYRVAPKQPPPKPSTFELVLTERSRVEWPLLGTVDRLEVRMLDWTGKPLPLELPLAADESGAALVVEVPLSAFARGEYAPELIAGSGGTSERRILTLTVK